MKVQVPVGKSSTVAKRMLIALTKHPFYSLPAHVMADVAVQLMCAGGDAAKVGHSVGEGVLKGLGEENKEKFPRCPYCGKRHAPPDMGAVAQRVRSKLESFGPNQ